MVRTLGFQLNDEGSIPFRVTTLTQEYKVNRSKSRDMEEEDFKLTRSERKNENRRDRRSSKNIEFEDDEDDKEYHEIMRQKRLK